MKTFNKTTWTLILTCAVLTAHASENEGSWLTVRGAFIDCAAPSDYTPASIRLPNGGTVEAQMILQPKRAKLVVILPGTFSRAKNAYTNGAAALYAGMGCHVLTFDSFFTPNFVERAKNGAAGNLGVEAELTVQIVEAFIAQFAAADRVGEVGVVGFSYGGGVALNVARLAEERELSFKLEGVQAYSVPVSFRDSVTLLDQYDTHTCSTCDMMKATWAAMSNTRPSPLDECVMEKLIAHSFKSNLPSLTLRVDGLYRDGLTFTSEFYARFNELGRCDADPAKAMVEAQSVTFADYMQMWMYEYWKTQGAGSLEDVMKKGDLSWVLPQVGRKVNVVVVVTSDDPLNLPGKTEGLKQIKTAAEVVVLPGGGHLGDMRNPNYLAQMKKLFHAHATWVAQK